MATLQRLRLQLSCGGWLVADVLPGRGPCYLYLHGLGSVRAGEKSDSLLRHASAQHRAVVRFDFRGHGESSGRLGDITISELVADSSLLLQRFGPCIVVGSSLGGLVAALLASRAPSLVVGLCLLAPAFGFMTRLATRLAPDRSMMISDGRRFVVSERVLRDASELPEAKLPQQIQVPTLVVHGTQDEVVPVRHSEQFHADLLAPRKQLWLVERGDHRLNTIANAVWPRLDGLLRADPDPP